MLYNGTAMAANPKPKNVLLPIFLIVAVDILGLTIILPLLPLLAAVAHGCVR